MGARLRLLFALFLMSVGTWFGALAISGYYEPSVVMRTEPVAVPANLSPAADAAQSVSLVSRKRFLAVEAPEAPATAKPKAQKTAAKPKPPPADKRAQQAAVQLPWPLSLFNN